jgi:TatD DNase family protein
MPTTPLIDTHAHLCDPRFDDDREDVLRRARTAGVATVVAVGETLDDARRNLELADRHPELRPAAGLYPTHLDPDAADAMEVWIRAHRDRLVAIGEVGLDRWAVREERDRELQRAIFLRSVALARELDLPLNIHSRSAGRHAVEALLEAGATRVHLHAFDGRVAAAMPAVEAGFLFSVPPSIVRSAQKRKLVRGLPLTSLMLESDSPVLGPDPAARNEPANVRIAMREIAELHGVPEDAVAEITTENAIRLYRL